MPRNNGRAHLRKVTANNRGELAKKLGDKIAAFPQMVPSVPNDLVANAFFLRSQLLNQLIDPRRNIDGECGYPDYISPDMYRAIYDRHGVGKRAVEVYPTESWAMDPEVAEDEDPTSETEFETALEKLVKKQNLWGNLQRADVMSGIGCFGVMFLGLDDGKDMRLPVRQGTGDLELDRPATQARRLLYLRHFDHSLARVTRYDLDTKSPRYGQPEIYSLSFADYRNGEIQSGSVAETTMRDVHWSRVIHFADNRRTSETFGMPRMMCIFNNLMDIKKMLGGSAEMFWKGGFPGFSFESTPNLNDLGADISISEDAVRAQMDAYQNGLQRYFALLGVQVKSLAPQAVPPNGHLEEQYKAITVAMDVPMRVFMGSEQAQLASGMDALAWNKRVKRRQDKYVGPHMIRTTIDRLIWLGVLPPPAELEYTINWPDLSSPTDMDKAQTAAARTGALATYVSSGIEQLYPPREYLTKELGFEVDEADAILEAAQEHGAEMEQQQADQADQQAALMKKHGMVPQQGGPVGGPGGVSFGRPEPKPPAAGGAKGKATKAKKKPTRNAKYDRLGRPMVVNDDKFEAQHPRGQPDNKGKFTKKRVNEAATDPEAARLLEHPPTDADINFKHLARRLKQLTVWEVRALGRKYKIALGNNKNESIKRLMKFYAKKNNIQFATADIGLAATRKRKPKIVDVEDRPKAADGKPGDATRKRYQGGFARVPGTVTVKRRRDRKAAAKAVAAAPVAKKAGPGLATRERYRVVGGRVPGTATVKRRKDRKAKVAQFAGRPERKLPNLPDVADWKMGIKQELAEGTITNSKNLGGGINETYIITYDNGMKGVWKPTEGAHGNHGGGDPLSVARREAAASTLADALEWKDLVPPTIMRSYDGKIGSVQHFAEGAVISRKEPDKPFDGRENAQRMAAFDYLIGNQDRHQGNFMVSQPNKDKLIAIDHGYAFPTAPDNSVRSAPLNHVKLDIIPEAYKTLDSKVPKVKSDLLEMGLDQRSIDAVIHNITVLCQAAKDGLAFGKIPGLRIQW